MPRRVVIDPAGSPRQVPPPATSDAARRRRRAEPPADDTYTSPGRRQQSRHERDAQTERAGHGERATRGERAIRGERATRSERREPATRAERRTGETREQPRREVPRREVPRREVPRRSDNDRRAGTPAEELIRRATASREAARQIAARRAAESQVQPRVQAPVQSRAQSPAEPRVDAPVEAPRRSVGRHTGEHHTVPATHTGEHHTVPASHTGEHRTVPATHTGEHHTVPATHTGEHHTVPDEQSTAAERGTSRRDRTWRDGPREEATWGDTTRREVPRRQRGATPAPTAPGETSPADAPSATVIALDSARRDLPRRRADRRATEPDGETTTTRALAVLGRATRRRDGNHATPGRESTRRESTRQESAPRDSSHREARNRRATSREIPHARDTGPRRHRRVTRKRIGAGLLTMLTIAVGVTAAAGYALSRPESLTPITSTAARSTPCNQTGPGQREVETYLATRSAKYGRVVADGRQSAADCTAISSFQRWAQVPVQTGFADVTTGFLARQLAAIQFDQCQAPGDRMTVCVDLTNQAMWVVQAGRIVLGPTAARSGRPGQETPTGKYTITQKKVQTVSSEFGTPLPYWERFVDDIGFHTADTPMYSPIAGSFGCINLLDRDAKALYALTKIGTSVNVFGEKPGT